jgi:putative FmdB family regulatory protein
VIYFYHVTYEYICKACGHEWEAEQSIKADPLKKCPKCKKDEAKRLVSGGLGFQLKGGGWAKEGYK